MIKLNIGCNNHFIEHLNETEALIFLKECYRLLKPGGVIRTTTFSIDDIMTACIEYEKYYEYLDKMFDGRFKDKARIEFFNFAVYEAGGHKYMWNNDELIRYLKVVGFSNFNMPKWKESDYQELKDLEYRKNTTCIVEAIK